MYFIADALGGLWKPLYAILSVFYLFCSNEDLFYKKNQGSVRFGSVPNYSVKAAELFGFGSVR